MVKYTKIKKWAAENGFEVQVREAKWDYDYDEVKVWFDKDRQNGIEIEYRDSTIYHSIRGMRGEAAGIYVRDIRNGKEFRYAFHRRTQGEIIENVKYDFSHMDIFK